MNARLLNKSDQLTKQIEGLNCQTGEIIKQINKEHDEIVQHARRYVHNCITMYIHTYVRMYVYLICARMYVYMYINAYMYYLTI